MDSRFSLIVRVITAVIMLGSMQLDKAQTSRSSPLPSHEILTYDVGWSVFTAGRVVATLVSPSAEGPNTSEITTTARTQGFASLLFKVQDDFHSFFDSQTLCSRRILKKVDENSRHRQIEITFNTERGVAIHDERDLNAPNAPPKHVENKISGCVEDIVTAFYFLRQQQYRVGHDVHLSMNDGGQTHDVAVEVQAREQLQTALGNRMAFRVEPKIFGTLYDKKGKLLVWFSDDEQHLPLRIKMTISVGTITGNLKSILGAFGTNFNITNNVLVVSESPITFTSNTLSIFR